jgi:hypothetical protein
VKANGKLLCEKPQEKTIDGKTQEENTVKGCLIM